MYPNSRCKIGPVRIPGYSGRQQNLYVVLTITVS
jgi:hypothetical protein